MTCIWKLPIGHTAFRWCCIALAAWGLPACGAFHMKSNPLKTEVEAMRLRGYRVVKSSDGYLANDKEAWLKADLDSGRTYVLLARCDCRGMSVKVAPYSLGNVLLPYHLLDNLAEVYSERAPRLTFVAPQRRAYMIKIRMSRCGRPPAGQVGPDLGCSFGVYLLHEPQEAPPPPTPDPSGGWKGP